MENTPEKQRRSGLAIAGLVIGIVALLTSLLPFINNMSFFVALIGAVLAIAGLIGCMRGKRAGKGLAIAAIVVNVAAVAAVLVSQSMYSAAIDDAMNGPQAVQSSDGQGSSDSKGAADSAELAVGSSVELENGLVVTVLEVTPGLENYDGSNVTCVKVSYENKGDETASFNQYDWKGENETGVQSDVTIFTEGEDELSSGDLVAGGTAAGNIYFDGDLTKVLYFSNMFADDAAASWVIE